MITNIDELFVFIEEVAKDLNTDKENIYINTSASIDGALVK